MRMPRSILVLLGALTVVGSELGGCTGGDFSAGDETSGGGPSDGGSDDHGGVSGSGDQGGGGSGGAGTAGVEGGQAGDDSGIGGAGSGVGGTVSGGASSGMGGASGSGGTVTRPCDPDGPFGSVRELDINTAEYEGGAVISPDGQTMYFDAYAGPLGIYRATRSSPTDPFEGRVLVPGPINTSDPETAPVFSPDGLTLFFVRNMPQGVIMAATRPNTSAEFDAVAMARVNGDRSLFESPSAVSADGRTLYHNSNRTQTSYDLYSSPIASDGTLGDPTPIDELNSPQTEGYMVLAGDRIAYFMSNRPPSQGDDIYRATRATPDADFGTPEPVTELNGATNDMPSWVSPDDCTLIFFTNTTNEPMSSDGYIARRPP